MYRENCGKGKEAQKVILELKMDNKFIRLSRYMGNERVYTPIQRHTDVVIKITERDFPPRIGDAVITNLKNFEIGVRTADCVPIVILGEDWVGVIHAGWKGLMKKIIRKTVEELKKYEKGKLKAFIFPAAKSCCYEVGNEFKEIFSRNLVNRDNKLYFDTQEEAKYQLLKEGIEDLFIWEKCTVCSDELPSYRRDKTESRILTSVKIEG